MADILCGYTADRDETLVAYLYGDIEPSQRAAFDAHIATCERCRHELGSLRRLRGQLQTFMVPEIGEPLALPVPSPSAVVPLPAVVTGPAPGASPWRALRDVPAWARLSAAMLVLGVSAGIAGAMANLEVRYDHDGIAVRTGWSHAAPGDTSGDAASAARPQATTAGTAARAEQPWKGDLDALERRLRTELRDAQPSAAPLTASHEQATTGAATAVAATTGAATTDADAQLLRRVRALVEESERRQRNELSLRIAEVVQDFDAKRGSDLANIRNMKTIQSATGLEVVRQQQWLNLLTQASAQGR